MTFAVAPVAGQVKVTVAAPVAVARPAEQPQGMDEVGVTVELPENPNLSLYLKKAKSQLAEDPPKYDLAIQLLQSVIDGRTDEAVTAGEEVSVDKPDGAKPDGAKPDGAKAKADPPKADPAKGDGKTEVQKPPRLSPAGRPGAGMPAAPPPAAPLDPSQCVFSSDGRLYRPVRRLCHELLATMPTAGLQRYRAFHEYEAEQMLQKATLDGDLPGLEQVGNRYFITLAAGKAMLTSADLLMHQGRYRAAVQVLRDLLEIYPAENRRLLAVEDVWLQFKIALAMRLAGELGAAHDAAVELAQKYPQATLRIMGELQAAKDLPASPLFAGGGGDVDTGSGRRASGPAWLAEVDALVPLWQFRYAEPQPYKSTPNREQQNGGMIMGPDGGVTRNVAPPANKHGTGTSLAFLGEGEVRPNVLFLDHFCLRRGDPFTGLITNAGSGPAEMRAPRDGQPRSRVPSLDWGMLRPVEDDARYFTVTGYSGTSATEVLKSTDLIAWNKRDLSQAWSSREWLDGDNGLRDVIFLAAPTVFGERVLVPVKRKDGYYSLQCLDRQTGKPLWCTRLHAGGSQFYRAPGVPARVQGGIAYVLTNAGALAAIDAFSGNLKWIRRYERRDPLRPSKVASKAQSRDPRMMMMQQQMPFMEEDLPAYLPSDLVLAEGCVLFAPCDGDMLLCLDGASGEPVWMIDGSSKYQLHKQLQYLLGANSRYVFAVSEDALVCIGLRSGVRLWHAPLPNDKEKWRGRGYVTEDFVLMPGNRELLVMPTAGGTWRRVALPGLGVGKEPLSGPCNLFLSGPWLGVCYAGGLEVYSAVPALLALAAASAEPLAKAGFLAQAGELQKGVQVLEGALATLPAGNPDQPKNAAHMLDLVRDLSRQLGGEGKEAEARAWLDRVRPFATDRTVRLNWHLARMDLFQQCSDLRAYEDEQQSLYRFLEGKDQ